MATKTRVMLCIEAIEHWERMIVFAKGCDPKFIVNEKLMKMVLGEDWHSECCSFCRRYAIGKYVTNCKHCPIVKADFLDCDYSGSKWVIVTGSATWGEWVCNAKEMLKMLRKVLKYEEANRIRR